MGKTEIDATATWQVRVIACVFHAHVFAIGGVASVPEIVDLLTAVKTPAQLPPGFGDAIVGDFNVLLTARIPAVYRGVIHTA